MRVSRSAAMLIFVGLLCTARVEARDRPIHYDFDRRTIRAYNISLTSFFSLLSAVRQHQVTSWSDAARHFLIGTGAGISDYQAKRLTGDGHVTAGWLLTNATASVLENTASGEHVLGRFGYTVGPLRFRIATPLVQKGIARIEMDWSLAETYSLREAINHGEHVRWRNGLIAVDRDDPWADPDVKGHFFEGRTYGVFPGVIPKAEKVLWNHEVIHAEQQQQIDSVEWPFCTFGKDKSGGPRGRLFAFRHVRLGFVHIADLPTYKRHYENRWPEIEAYALAQRTPVPIPVPVP